MPEPRKPSVTAKASAASPATHLSTEPPAIATKAEVDAEPIAANEPFAKELNREVEQAADVAQAANEQVAAAAAETQDRTTRDTLFFADEAVRLATRNMEALIICTNAASKAAGDMTHTAMEFGQRNFRHASTALRGLSEARSASELLALQTQYVQALVEDVIEEGCRVTDSAIRVFGEVMEPKAMSRPDQD